MAKQVHVPANFLADLDVVAPKINDGNLPSTFAKHLEDAYKHALLEQPVISIDDLMSTAQELDAWRSHHQGILEQRLAQLPSDDPLVSPISLFGTMDYGRLETAHTRALAWLLGDREHGFGYQLLETLLRHVLEGRQVRLTNVNRVESEYPVFCGPTSAGAGRIDILAEGCWEELGKEVSWLLAIEAKIDADEGEEQLCQYDDWLDEHCESGEIIRLFVTSDGREPTTSSADWQVLSFLDLAGIFRRSSGLQESPGYHFLRHYLTGLLRDVCGLPVPISPNCKNPYAAVDYLQLVLGTAT